VGQSAILGRFYGFSPKWRLKPFSVPVFTSDSNSSSSTLLVTIYISIGYVGDFLRYTGVKVQKYKNYLNELQEFPIRDFLIFCGSCCLLSCVRNVGTAVLPRLFLATFSIVGFGNFQADFRHFANMPDLGANISGMGKDRPAKFSRLIRPSG